MTTGAVVAVVVGQLLVYLAPFALLAFLMWLDTRE